MIDDVNGVGIRDRMNDQRYRRSTSVFKGGCTGQHVGIFGEKRKGDAQNSRFRSCSRCTGPVRQARGDHTHEKTCFPRVWVVLARVTHNTRKDYLWHMQHFPMTPLRASQRLPAALALIARMHYSGNGIAMGNILITVQWDASWGSRKQCTGAVCPARGKSIRAPVAAKFAHVQISNHSRSSRANFVPRDHYHTVRTPRD